MRSNEQDKSGQSNQTGSMTQGESCGCHNMAEEKASQCHKTISQHLQEASDMYRKAEKEYDTNKEKAISYEHQGYGHVMIAMKCIKKSIMMCAQKSSSQSQGAT